jgi:sulfite reductase (ferredoxin)
MSKTYYNLPPDLTEDIENYSTEVERFLAGDLSPSIFKARRVPRGIYEQRQDGAFMTRVRIAGGTVTGEQMRALADLSKRFGKGTLHVTTRQDVQIHDVSISDTPEIMRGLYTAGLTSKGGGGNTVRNIMACPYSGMCPAEVFDVAPFAHAVTQYLITLPGSYNLPRKYKISFSGCGSDCALAQVNDLGFFAKILDGKLGFSIYAGGGMGGHPRVGDLLERWVPTTEVIRIAEAVRRLFDWMGDRHNRKRARLRFVFEKIGVNAFRKEYKKELELVAKEDVPTCDVIAEITENATKQICNPESVLEEKNGVRYFAQGQPGFAAVPLHIPLGNISSGDFIKLADIAEKFSTEKGLRTTQSQNLLIPFVREEDLPALAGELGQLSIDVLAPSPLESFVVCAGSSTCRLGLCLSPNLASACADALGENGLDLKALRGVDIRINGCPNCCGQHPVGTIGLFGVAQREEGRLVPTYKITLGARRGEGKTRLSENAGFVPARAMPRFMLDLLKDFQENCDEVEAFADYYDRKGVEHFKQLIERHSRVPSYEENPDFYKDFGQEEDFSLAGRGPSECGAGVFEVITEDITAAKKLLEEAHQVEDKNEGLFNGAVAAREAITSIGSDTGGSIRQPASFCGVTGLKPTYGRVSRYGLVAFASSLDQIGPFGKSVDDVALMMNAIAGYDKRDSTSVNELVPDYTAGLDGNLKNLKIGVPIQYFEKGLEHEVKAAVEKAMESLHKLGAHLIEVNMPHTEYAIATYYILATAEASSNLARYDGVKYGHRTEQKSSLIDMYKRTKDEGFGDEVKRRILLGTYVLSSGYYDAYYLKAQKVRTLVKQDFDHAFEKVDCLITPTSPSTAYHIGENIDDPLKMYLMDIFTISANLAGIPGLSVPCGFDHKGLPIGFQLLGKVFGEETVLKIGHAYQQQTDFHTKRPPVLDEETAEIQS